MENFLSLKSKNGRGVLQKCLLIPVLVLGNNECIHSIKCKSGFWVKKR